MRKKMGVYKRDIFEYILDFKRSNDGHFPTIREIRDACNIPSTSTVSYALERLLEDGFLYLLDHPKEQKRYGVVGGFWTTVGKETVKAYIPTTVEEAIHEISGS